MNEAVDSSGAIAPEGKKLSYYERNKAKCAASAKRWAEKNKEKRQAWLKNYMATYNRQYWEKHRDRMLKAQADYRANNGGKIKAWRDGNKDYWKKWGKKNSVRIKAKSDAWRAANLERCRATERARYKRTNGAQKQREKLARNPNLKIASMLRSRINMALRNYRNRPKKAANTISLLGCTYTDFLKHIESLFTDGMSWEKVWSGEIHIDHIKPCASFDLSDPSQQRACFHFSNTQPLWEADNLAKGDKILAVVDEPF